MDDVLDQGVYLHFDAQFFTEFAVEALLKTFAGFAFAAGKFPQPGKVPAGGPPRDQQFSIAKNQTGGNFNRIFGWRPGTLDHGLPPGIALVAGGPVFGV
jgi:hypothetical protein